MSKANPKLDQPTTLRNIFKDMSESLGKNLLEKWYPLAVDNANGGYYTDISYDWKIEPVQYKMAVTQGRQMWTAAKAAQYFDSKLYADVAKHGFDFFRDKMWDQKYGGFYQMRDYRGESCDYLEFYDEKRTYGNAFLIYGLAALYELTGDAKVLDFAKEAFHWVEEHAFDPKGGGYFQFLTREGKPFGKNDGYKTKADDAVEAAYKDQNSSIHLLEAYTELYSMWHDEMLKEKLHGLLKLIRDVITTPEGYMNLFFDYDWKPVSFRDAPKDVREKSYRLEHVSFGHNYETGFLMLEASHVLGLKDDVKTLTVAKKMLDHAIRNGWEKTNGGFVDAAYYFAGDKKCTIIHDTKNWWAQAEALNVLLMMSKIFPDENIYGEYFVKEWNYVDKFLLDHKHGDWFEGGLDKQPHYKTGLKGHIWKAAYHTGRSLMNCTKMLSKDFPDISPINKGFIKAAGSLNEFLDHWKKVAQSL
jgi:mannobiose 2-epimerase